MNEQQHEMVLEETKSGGEENWFCPACGRRMMITWNPWKKIVLEQGDIDVAHSGGKGGIKLGAVHLGQGDQVSENSAAGPSGDDPSLAPWQRWLDSIDSDHLWNKEL